MCGNGFCRISVSSHARFEGYQNFVALVATRHLTASIGEVANDFLPLFPWAYMIGINLEKNRMIIKKTNQWLNCMHQVQLDFENKIQVENLHSADSVAHLNLEPFLGSQKCPILHFWAPILNKYNME